MHLKAFFIMCLVHIFFQQIQANGKYTVIGPGTIHSEGKYTVAVAVHHTSEPCQIKVGISGPSYNETKTVQLNSGQIENVHFDVPTLANGIYNLTAEGVQCMDNFYNSTKLNYAKFNNHVRIQTDKGLYKPGDTINYRVLFLDKDLKPAQPNENAKIWIEDAKSNRIKEIKDFEVKKGVHTGKFKISEHPAVGGWRLGVANGQRYDTQVYFDVNKYVLPKYVINVKATESVSVKDGDMQIVVRANYTYGKPLNGKVTAILNLGYSHFRYPYFYDDNNKDDEERKPQERPTIIKTANMVNGKAKIDANVKAYEPFMRDKHAATYLEIVVTVEEEFTGVKLNETVHTTIYPYRYSIKCISYDKCTTFVADKEAKVLLHLSYIDDTNLNDTKEPVELIYTEILHKYRFGYYGEVEKEPIAEPISENRTFHFTTTMNETGFAEFTVKLPDLKNYKFYNHFYKMEVKYRDEQHGLFMTHQFREPKKMDEPRDDKPKEPKEYFRIENRNYQVSPKIGEAAQFVVNSSRPLPYLDYTVVGRGNILDSQHIDLTDQPKNYNITVTPTYEWSPFFDIYIYYVDDKGEYHYAEATNYIEHNLQNQINITAAEQVKPGEEVSFSIKTAPNSLVALTAVDQSTLLLRSNNDLRADEFSWLLKMYATYTPHQGGYSYYPGSNTGVVTLTNADYFYNWTIPKYYSIPLSASAHAYFANDNYFTRTAAQGGTSFLAAAARPSYPSTERTDGVGGGGGGINQADIRVRKDFSETWIFDDIENTDTEEFTWVKKIPDTITSWVVTGFAMNSEVGLGVTADATKIITFQPFFISVRLPYSVKYGEVINVPALVFNYLNKDLDVEITLNNDADEYEFMDITNEVLNDKQELKKTVRVPAHAATGVSFMLRPKVVGNVMLKYTAVSPLAGDAVHKSMKVVAPGVTQYANRAYFVQLKDKPEFSDKLELELPEDVVPQSQFVEVGVIGDLLGPVLSNLDNLIRKPTGCGEQTMSKLVPNYLVMRYLEFAKKLTPSLKTSLLYNMETGYQNMLNFRLKDGSFRTFVPRNQDGEDAKQINGSTWLTAFVIHGLQKVSHYVDIDDKIINSGLQYLASRQAENGTFTDQGNFYYSGNRDPITLTSFTLLAFLQNATLAERYNQVINKGLEFIAQNLNTNSSLKDKALATYTLSKAKHSQASEQLNKLQALAKTEDDRKWWSTRDDATRNAKRWWCFVYNNDVEITGYALLTILEQDTFDIGEVVPIIRWLMAQRNSYGGFASTQDTVVGLNALITFAEKTHYEPGQMEVTFEANADDGATPKKEIIQLTEDNGLLYQTAEMPPKTTAITVTAKGSGTALIQISYQYNIFEKEPKPSFEIHTKKYEGNLAGKLMMDVCVQYTGEGEASNMALLEISLPSGFIVDEDIIKDLEEIPSVSNVEVKNSQSLLVVYFDHLRKNDEKCIPVEAFKSHAVALQKPASIVLYDYYEADRKMTIFYDIDSKLCDICDGEDECNKCKGSH